MSGTGCIRSVLFCWWLFADSLLSIYIQDSALFFLFVFILGVHGEINNVIFAFFF